MLDDPIAEYRVKRKELQATTAIVEKIVRIVTAAAADLRDWSSVRVSGTGSFPAHLSASSRSIDASTWPTGHEMGELLSKWHSMRFDTQRAFERIPLNQRAGIRPPPG